MKKEPEYSELRELANNLYEAIHWLPLYAKLRGPYGGWVYCISDKQMDRARRLIKRAKEFGLMPFIRTTNKEC